MSEKKKDEVRGHDEVPHSDEAEEELVNWKEEAKGIINDIKAHVAEIEIADGLPSTDSCIYLNLTTIEKETYCVQVSALGFRIVSNQYNTIDPDKALPVVRNDDTLDDNTSEQNGDKEVEIFETPYALLDKISPRYVDSFGNLLFTQLLHLQQMQEEFNEADEEEEQQEEETEEPSENSFSRKE